MGDPLLQRYADPALAMLGAKPNSEWTLFCDLGGLLERGMVTANALAVAEALLFQSPIGRCLVAPILEDGPNGALLTVRTTWITNPVVSYMTLPQGWRRKNLIGPLHLVALLAGPQVLANDDYRNLFGRLCELLGDVDCRKALVQCSTPQAFVEQIACSHPRPCSYRSPA